MQMYTNEYSRFPDPGQWTDLLIQHADVSPRTFVCPSDGSGNSGSYAMNEDLQSIKQNDVPKDLVLLFEANLGTNGMGGPEDVVLRHKMSGANILFADGSLEFVREDAIGQLLWDPAEP